MKNKRGGTCLPSSLKYIPKLLVLLYKRIYLGEILAVLDKAAEIGKAQDSEYHHTGKIQTEQFTSKRTNLYGQAEGMQRFYGKPDGVEQNHQHTQLRRTKFSIGQFERVLQVGA